MNTKEKREVLKDIKKWGKTSIQYWGSGPLRTTMPEEALAKIADNPRLIAYG